MQEQARVPAIRFAGFTDAWEQRKYGDVIELLSGQDFEPSQYNEVGDGIPYMTGASCIVNGSTIENRWTLVPRCIAYQGEVLLVCKGSGYGTLARLGQEKAHIARQFMDLRCTDVLNNTFNYYLAFSVVKEIKKNARGLIAGIDRSAILKQAVSIPQLAEQEKIGQYFSYLDHLITLHQRKYSRLCNVKKSMLEKMFPKDGASVPEIRFAGFTDAWEQRKFSELAEKTYGGGTPTTLNEAFWDGNIPWIQSSDITDSKLFGVMPRKYITEEGLNKSATQLVPENSIAIITRVGVGKLAFMPFSYTTSQDFLSLSRLNTEPFFTVYACYKKLQSELNAVQGTSIKGITKDELLAKAVMVPKYKEQQQIGAFFRHLDHLITLHQRELERLQNIKKACLEKMFV